MLHLNHIGTKTAEPSGELMKKASGRYYTGEPVGRRLANVVARHLAVSCQGKYEIRVLDPFGGDGRLLIWLIEAWTSLSLPKFSWRLELWDLDNAGFDVADFHVQRLREQGVDVTCEYIVEDAFHRGLSCSKKFDAVITNPPWELLKPDRREIEHLESYVKTAYVADMRRYDSWLAKHYPLSQPRRKFAGWGTNLSRVGLELTMSLARESGVFGIVLPASVLADDQSINIRKQLLTAHRLRDVAYYSAEAKLYECADVESVTLVAEAFRCPLTAVPMYSHENLLSAAESTEISLNFEHLEKFDFALPISFGAQAVKLLYRLSEKFSTWGELEGRADGGFWAGREVDETGSANWLVPIAEGTTPFLKGRMVDRYQIRDEPVSSIAKIGWTPPVSVKFERIAWRDVSRPSQKRRMVAALVPSGWALGNSLGVAHFYNAKGGAIRALLGVMNSTVFEFMLRSHLATGHISLSALRKVPVPSLESLEADVGLQNIVADVMSGSVDAELVADAYVALNVYGLQLSEYEMILGLFQKMGDFEKESRRLAYKQLIERAS